MGSVLFSSVTALTRKSVLESTARVRARVPCGLPCALVSHRPFSSKSTTAATRPSVPSKYYVDRDQRDGKKCHFNFDPLFTDRLVKTTRQSPTRELNYGHAQWQGHKEPWRRVRHLFSFFNSSPLKRLLLPDLGITASIAAGLSYYNVFLAPPGEALFMDGSAMTGATTAIGLLAAFRLNASYGRYEEARKFWGEVNNSARDLAGEACMWILSPCQKHRMLRLIQAFPVALQFHLNEKGGHYEMKRDSPDFSQQKYAEFYAEMADIYHDPNHPDFVQICSTYYNGNTSRSSPDPTTNVPLVISAIMRSIIASNSNHTNEHNNIEMYNREMDQQVQRLVGCLGMCERVLRTPIPTCFTRHTSRLFFFWSSMLPFAMYSSLGPIGVVPGSVMISYAVVAVEDVGVQLEEPFNILPLRQYSDSIYHGINIIESNYTRASNITAQQQQQQQRQQVEIEMEVIPKNLDAGDP